MRSKKWRFGPGSGGDVQKKLTNMFKLTVVWLLAVYLTGVSSSLSKLDEYSETIPSENSHGTLTSSKTCTAFTGRLFFKSLQYSHIEVIEQILVYEQGQKVLPQWLTFNFSTLTFYGVPLEADIGCIKIVSDVFLDQGNWISVQDIFTVCIHNSNDCQSSFQSYFESISSSSIPIHNDLISSSHLKLCELQESSNRFPNYCTVDETRYFLNLQMNGSSIESFSGSERAQLIISISQNLNICPFQFELLSSMIDFKFTNRRSAQPQSYFHSKAPVISLLAACNNISHSFFNKTLNKVLKDARSFELGDIHMIYWNVATKSCNINSSEVVYRHRREMSLNNDSMNDDNEVMSEFISLPAYEITPTPLNANTNKYNLLTVSSTILISSLALMTSAVAMPTPFPSSTFQILSTLEKFPSSFLEISVEESFVDFETSSYLSTENLFSPITSSTKLELTVSNLEIFITSSFSTMSEAITSSILDSTFSMQSTSIVSVFSSPEPSSMQSFGIISTTTTILQASVVPSPSFFYFPPPPPPPLPPPPYFVVVSTDELMTESTSDFIFDSTLELTPSESFTMITHLPITSDFMDFSTSEAKLTISSIESSEIIQSFIQSDFVLDSTIFTSFQSMISPSQSLKITESSIFSDSFEIIVDSMFTDLESTISPTPSFQMIKSSDLMPVSTILTSNLELIVSETEFLEISQFSTLSEFTEFILESTILTNLESTVSPTFRMTEPSNIMPDFTILTSSLELTVAETASPLITSSTILQTSVVPSPSFFYFPPPPPPPLPPPPYFVIVSTEFLEISTPSEFTQFMLESTILTNLESTAFPTDSAEITSLTVESTLMTITQTEFLEMSASDFTDFMLDSTMFLFFPTESISIETSSASPIMPTSQAFTLVTVTSSEIDTSSLDAVLLSIIPSSSFQSFLTTDIDIELTSNLFTDITDGISLDTLSSFFIVTDDISLDTLSSFFIIPTVSFTQEILSTSFPDMFMTDFETMPLTTTIEISPLSDLPTMLFQFTASPSIASSAIFQTSIAPSPSIASSAIFQTSVAPSPSITSSAIFQTSVAPSPLITSSAIFQTSVAPSPSILYFPPPPPPPLPPPLVVVVSTETFATVTSTVDDLFSSFIFFVPTTVDLSSFDMLPSSDIPKLLSPTARTILPTRSFSEPMHESSVISSSDPFVFFPSPTTTLLLDSSVDPFSTLSNLESSFEISSEISFLPVNPSTPTETIDEVSTFVMSSIEDFTHEASSSLSLTTSEPAVQHESLISLDVVQSVTSSDTIDESELPEVFSTDSVVDILLLSSLNIGATPATEDEVSLLLTSVSTTIPFFSSSLDERTTSTFAEENITSIFEISSSASILSLYSPSPSFSISQSYFLSSPDVFLSRISPTSSAEEVFTPISSPDSTLLLFVPPTSFRTSDIILASASGDIISSSASILSLYSPSPLLFSSQIFFFSSSDALISTVLPTFSSEEVFTPISSPDSTFLSFVPPTSFRTSDIMPASASSDIIQPTPNFGPILLNPIGVLLVDEGQPFKFEIPTSAFFSQEGSLGNFQMALYNSTNGQLLSSTSWVQIGSNNIIEGLALFSETSNGFVTDHKLILIATDSNGFTATDTITIRVFPQTSIENFAKIFIDGNFTEFSNNLTKKLELVNTLNGLSRTNEVLIRSFSSGSIGILFTNLTISQLNCEAFREWFRTIYDVNDYTPEFRKQMEPFLPVGRAEATGICIEQDERSTTVSIDPSVAFVDNQRIESIIIPIVTGLLACLLLLVFALICCCCSLRLKRPERKNFQSQQIFHNQKPIILPGELEAIPPRSRKSVMLPNRGGYMSLLQQDDTEVGFIDFEENYKEELVSTSHFENISVLPPSYKSPPQYFESRL